MKKQQKKDLPHRQRRVPFVFQNAPTYFLAFCTANRKKMLANQHLFNRACEFVEAGNSNADFFVSALMIMPDHIHALVSISPQSKLRIGNWVRAFKRTVGETNIKWQEGFFDHILRNHESRSEKWEYIRDNPVRAELVQHSTEWPYQRWFQPATGETCAPDEDIRPTDNAPDEDIRPTDNAPDEDVRPTDSAPDENVRRNAPSPTKSNIRDQIAQAKKFQTLEEMSTKGLENFQTLEIFQQAQAIGAYMPLPDEVDVTPLFGVGSAGAQAVTPAKALPENTDSKGRANSPSEPAKRFYIPAFDEAAGGYRMAKHTPELKKGKFGIPEPEHPVWAGPDGLDLILVPGVAFDLHGNRLGRGGGFYDRLLPQYNAVRAGICFDFQTLENIPSEPHDCRMDLLITESKILKFSMNS